MMVKDPVTGRFHPRPKRESHTTVTSEPDGSYRFHFTSEKPVAPDKPAQMEARVWLVG